MLNQVTRHEDVLGEGGIVTLSTTWKWKVGFTPQPLHPRRELDRRLGWP